MTSGREAARRRRETVEEQRGDAAMRLAYDDCDAGVLVLHALLSYGLARDAGCYPSLAELSDRTRLGRDAVRSRLACLVKAGIITDSGKRRGNTGQIKVWTLGGTVEDALAAEVRIGRARSEADGYAGRKRRPLSGRLANPPGRDRTRTKAGPKEDRPPPSWATPDQSESEGTADA